MNNVKYTIYFAGDLFDQKHITGNYLLAQQIEKLSNNRYTCFLPQNWEGQLNSSIEIRNRDIQAIVRADVILFNFDGVDIDSGTIVEFIIAKMLDIPAVLLRTDCRNNGYFFGDDWNVMLYGFPRSVIIKHNALMLNNTLGLEETHRTIAQSVIETFDKVIQEPVLLKTQEEIFSAYQHVIKMCGLQLDQLITPENLQEIIREKKKRGIY
jgi:nucleoside 2-deoxyribosyltransferase